LTAESEDEPPSKRLKKDRIASTLEFSGGRTFAIDDHSLQKLQGSTWLNDQIVLGALRLIADVSDKCLVAEPLSFALRHGHDHRYNKVLLPMRIRQNHWVLSVYDQERVLIYNSLPTVGIKDDVSSYLHDFFSKTLQIDIRDYPHIGFTSPLRQSNNSNYGVIYIVTGFYKALNVVVPLEIDTTVWRNVLLRLLRPPDPSNVDKYRADLIDIPKLQP
jgi:Ulp1 family protease